MSDRAVSQAVLPSTGRHPFFGTIVQGLGFLVRVLASPLRLLLALRRSMTTASVTLLLIGIVSMNIIWGYPWLGLFSACFSLMFVGWGINCFMRPRLQIDFSLPNSSPAGQPFSVVVHAKNRSRFPAMDLSFGFARRARRGPGGRNGRAGTVTVGAEAGNSDRQNVSLISPLERIDISRSLAFDRRGVQALPDVVVTSTFPFHLFRSTRRYASRTSIAITPRLLIGDEDAVARGLLNTLGGWSHRLLSGDALDYTGSREYEVGMPVRRWDFNSWARLGRPIVREFQSPSIQMAMLIVDTSVSAPQAGHDTADEPVVERVLSLAATAVTDLIASLVRVDLYVTSESPLRSAAWSPTLVSSDREALLIRLAQAETISGEQADRRISEAIQHAQRAPVLVLTARDGPVLHDAAASHVTILRVDLPHRDLAPGRDGISVRQTRPNADASREPATP